MTEAAVTQRKHRPKGGKTAKPRRSTAHLKLVPQVKSVREQLRAEASRVAGGLDRSRPLSQHFLEQSARAMLERLGLEEGYLGFAMVTISNEFWRDQLMAVDFSRRLLLLPHCLKHAEGCPADYDEFGLDCRKCGACAIADFKVTAEDLGYKVLVAEGTPIVLKIILSGYVDAIIGVACLNVLEKALDKVLQVGVPSLAVPLLSSDCKNTSVDDDWVSEVISMRAEPPAVRTRTYVPLMRAANDLFSDEVLEQLAGRPRRQARAASANGNGKARAQVSSNGSNGRAKAENPLDDPVAATEAIGFQWLGKGGKRFRPFITLAGYDALKGADESDAAAGAEEPGLSDAVRRVAVAIETFHKASLVHDDIEDDDTHRYGAPTMHRRHGLSVALNVGDYLIGLGYRLVSREAAHVGADCAADILDRLADAHVKLSEGQGAELAWRQNERKVLTPLDAMKIYALKTAPAFEVALYSGLRLAGPADAYAEMVPAFSRNLGVAFQILNDLKDWRGDEENQRQSGQDVLAARPTLLLALAFDSTDDPLRTELLEAMALPERPPATMRRVREIFSQARVVEKADQLVQKYRERAEAIADEVEPTSLRELLYFLVDTVLEDHAEAEPEVIHPVLPLVQVS